MLAATPLIAFVPTTDPARAKMFFRDTLGLTLVGEDPFALVFDAGGTMLRVVTVQQSTPASYTILGWIVADVGRTVSELNRRGIVFRRFEGMGQDDDGIWTAPGGARIAWFQDPDGNTLSLTQFEQRRD